MVKTVLFGRATSTLTEEAAAEETEEEVAETEAAATETLRETMKARLSPKRPHRAAQEHPLPTAGTPVVEAEEAVAETQAEAAVTMQSYP